MIDYFIDAAAATCMRRQCVGGRMWAGLLVGRASASPAPIHGHVLLPPMGQSGEHVRLDPRHVGLLANVLPDGGVPVGLLVLAPAAVDVCAAGRTLLTNGALVCVVPAADGNVLHCRDLATGQEASLIEVEDLCGLTERSDVEAAADAFWQQLVGEPLPATPSWRCVLGAPLAQSLEAFARAAPRAEVGGILLGTRHGPTTHALAAAFPPQAHSGWNRCEFETATLAAVCDALGTNAALRPVGWIHTHPHLGVFLSDTDVTTFRQWSALDPRAVALVLDPFAAGSEWLACNSRCRRVVLEVRERAPDSGEAAHLARALARPGRAGSGWQVVCGADTD
ncbi:MAG: Mov34/MPN/PAD-1 family protein [Gemmataceae bacterium]|nr:Mov34/MPN/PAD-1 family protein [Gemmataceae bacterium]